VKIRGIHYSFEGMHWIEKSPEEIRKDLKAIKDMGANAVKLNGYDDHVFEIAEMGPKRPAYRSGFIPSS